MAVHESATQRCPECRRSFRVLADERGTHACPHCGYDPHEDEKPELQEAKGFGVCAWCDDSICPGDIIETVDGQTMHSTCADELREEDP